MRVGVWHRFAKARRYFWARVDVIVGLIADILAPDLLMPTSPAKASGSYTRYFAYEYTGQTSQEIAFYNFGNVTHTVTVSIYNPDGTLFGTENVTLRAYEEVSIVAPKATWRLLVAGGDGTPTTDEAYGIVATSDNSFFIIAASDGTSELPGTSKSAINPQGKLYTDSWWGIYNYPDAAKNDYVYIFNPNDTSTTVTFTVVDTDGTQFSSATNIAFTGGGGWAGRFVERQKGGLDKKKALVSMGRASGAGI